MPNRNTPIPITTAAILTIGLIAIHSAFERDHVDLDRIEHTLLCNVSESIGGDYREAANRCLVSPYLIVFVMGDSACPPCLYEMHEYKTLIDETIYLSGLPIVDLVVSEDRRRGERLAQTSGIVRDYQILDVYTRLAESVMYIDNNEFSQQLFLYDSVAQEVVGRIPVSNSIISSRMSKSDKLELWDSPATIKQTEVIL